MAPSRCVTMAQRANMPLLLVSAADAAWELHCQLKAAMFHNSKRHVRHSDVADPGTQQLAQMQTSTSPPHAWRCFLRQQL